jgi:hypothetical protein
MRGKSRQRLGRRAGGEDAAGYGAGLFPHLRGVLFGGYVPQFHGGVMEGLWRSQVLRAPRDPCNLRAAWSHVALSGELGAKREKVVCGMKLPQVGAVEDARLTLNLDRVLPAGLAL